MRKYWKMLVVVVQIMLVGSLVRGIFNSWSAGKRVDELVERKQKLIQEQEELRQKKTEVESEYYVEKVAREQLHLVKPGEVVVMTPDVDVVRTGVSMTNRDSNWRKWLAVFMEME